MIEPHNWSAEAEEGGQERRIVGHEDVGTVQDLRTIPDVFYIDGYFCLGPKLSDRWVPGMIVPYDVPTGTVPVLHDFLQD